MKFNDKIYVAGHRGLVGSAILRRLQALGYVNIVTRTHAELDLMDSTAVSAFFTQERPDYVFLAAAKVGGILANSTYPADFIYQNLAIQTNVIHNAWLTQVKRLLFLGSSCIYPRDCPQPIKEEYLLTGPLEKTNRPYAVAKIAGIEMCWSYYRQYGSQYLAVMPTNLYGPGDNYDLNNSHVLPALINKLHTAKIAGKSSTFVWGTGNPRREFLYSEDMADACIHIMNLSDDSFKALLAIPSQPPLINIGCGEDLTIGELVELVKDIIGFSGQIEWDVTKPDGTPRKLLDISKLRSTGWRVKINLRTGIRLAYQDFISRFGFN